MIHEDDFTSPKETQDMAEEELPMPPSSLNRADHDMGLLQNCEPEEGLEDPPSTMKSCLRVGKLPWMEERWQVLGVLPIWSATHTAANYWHLENRWKASRLGWRSPADVWSNPAARAAILEEAGAAVLKDGEGKKSLARRLLLSRAYTAKKFDPFAAAMLYKEIAEYTERNIDIVDPCAGWGDRLAAALASNYVHSYKGVDANKNLQEGYKGQIERYGDHDSFSVLHGAFEDRPWGEETETSDLVFTSPPYFNTEHYSMDTEQSDLRYPLFEDWVKGFLEPLIMNSYQMLRPGGILALNVMNTAVGRKTIPLIRKTVETAARLPLEQMGLYILPSHNGGRSPFDKAEPVLVWRKNHGG